MVLDVVLFRADRGGNPDLVRESQRRRHKPVEFVDQVIDLDNKWRQAGAALNHLEHENKQVQQKIAAAKKKSENADELLEQKRKFETEIELKKKEVAELLEQREKVLNRIGNIVHDSVPVSNDEAHNGLHATWGEQRVNPLSNLHHHELLAKIGGYDADRGVKVVGHRGYFLTGPGVRLNIALIQYGLDFLEKRGYTAMQAPYFMKREVMSETAQLEDFDEQLYHVGGETGEGDKYLIATSEQPISAFHRGEWLNPKTLPLRYAGYSACFRKESGSHGKDTWGIFRVHQFDKIEQFCITAPEKSWEMHEEMLKATELFYQSLGIPYRVVTIVSGELNNAAAKKYDLEGWFPSFGHYRELVSCSNCTDYQSRSLEIRYGNKKQGEKEKKYVHMLNSTLCACTRTICAILENYQTPEGIRVPDVLRPYMGGIDIIPFQKEAPEQKKGGGGAEKKEKKKGGAPAAAGGAAAPAEGGAAQ